MIRSTPFPCGGIFACAVSTVFLLSGCRPSVPEETGPPVRPAKLITVEQADNQRIVSFPAVFEARNTAVLSFLVGGTLEQIFVKSGDVVTRGTVIARLDPRTFRNRVAKAQTQFNEAVADFTRADLLLAKDAIARNVYEQRRSALEVARATLDDARKAIEDSVLTSPFDGVIAQRHLDENQNVVAGQAIVTVQTRGSVEAVINVPSMLVANSNAIESIETFVIIDARPDFRIPAKVSETSAMADNATQSFSVRLAFTPPEELVVLPGMTGIVEARIAISNGVYASQVVVPIGAVLSDGAEEYVWRVDPDSMLVARQSITTDRRVGETVIVTSGLAEGDLIVGAGAAYLHEGMQVRPYNP